MTRLSKKWARRLRIIFYIWLISSIAVVGYTFYIMYIVPKRHYDLVQQAAAYDAIIVPGVPFYEEKKWSFVMEARVRWAQHLYKIGKAKNIIYSGSAVYSPYIEAKIMALYSEALGVAPAHIFIESRAEHSTENLYYSLLIAKQQGFQRVALATDPFQTSMLKPFASAHNFDLGYIPILFPLLDKLPKTDVQIDPSTAFVNDFVALPERESWSERMSGTRGEKIQWDEAVIPLSK